MQQNKLSKNITKNEGVSLNVLTTVLGKYTSLECIFKIRIKCYKVKFQWIWIICKIKARFSSYEFFTLI